MDSLFRQWHAEKLLLLFLILFVCFPNMVTALQEMDDQMLLEDSPSLNDQRRTLETAPAKELKAIDDNVLENLSPALVAPEEIKIPTKEYHKILKQEFDNAVCFKCHTKNDFRASDHTQKQWRMLIEEDGHAIFSKIPWKDDIQKETTLNYLLINARNNKPESSGIGVWK